MKYINDNQPFGSSVSAIEYLLLLLCEFRYSQIIPIINRNPKRPRPPYSVYLNWVDSESNMLADFWAARLPEAFVCCESTIANVMNGSVIRMSNTCGRLAGTRGRPKMAAIKEGKERTLLEYRTFDQCPVTIRLVCDSIPVVLRFNLGSYSKCDREPKADVVIPVQTCCFYIYDSGQGVNQRYLPTFLSSTTLCLKVQRLTFTKIKYREIKKIEDSLFCLHQ